MGEGEGGSELREARLNRNQAELQVCLVCVENCHLKISKLKRRVDALQWVLSKGLSTWECVCVCYSVCIL